MIPFCGYYICWNVNLWDISFTNDVEWDQLLLCIEPHSCLMNQFLLDNSSMMYNWTYIRGSSGYSKKDPTETLITNKFIHPFVPCLLSYPSSFGSSSSSIYFLRKQHYMHPFTKLPVLLFKQALKVNNIVSYIYGVMAILCFEWITSVIKYKLITRNRLWNTGAVTQESLQNISLGKISVSFRVK